MTHPLQHVFDELSDVLDDFERAGYQGAESIFQRFVGAVDREPLASLITSLVPPVEFQSWYDAAKRTVGGMVGSGDLKWPLDRAERISMMREMFRAIERDQSFLFEIAHSFTYGGSGHYADDFHSFSQKIARPFLRDLGRLVNLRAEPPVLSEAIARPFTPSGDSVLDGLLNSARDGFRSPNPATRRTALEKLWDAWERLKTTDNTDKKSAVARLLDRAASEPGFRAVLEAEARALTDIGNTFQIRHFEMSRTQIDSAAHVDYLFHRLWALIWLLLRARQPSNEQPAA
jgi:hypothetical protein